MDAEIPVTDAAPVESQTDESPAIADQNAEPAPAKEQETKPKIDPVQRRIDRLTREKYELRGRLEAMERQMQERFTPAPTVQGEPKLSDFDDFDTYIRAKAEFVAEQKLTAALSKREQADQQAAQQRSQAEINEAWSKRLDAAKASLPDFDEVIETADVTVTPAMGQAILDSDKGPEISYYLARHPEEADRIAALSPVAAFRAIGRIEAKLETEAIAKKTSSAPKPVSPVGGRSGVGTGPSDSDSVEDWMKKRQAQLKRSA